MKGFTKLALVSAIAALPMTGFAMEALDDATMSDVTGQDGISITLGLDQSMDILIDDTDGTSLAGFGTSGGIFIIGQAINGGTPGTPTDVTVNIDAGGDGTDGVLQVGISLAAGTTITTGSIHVGNTTGAGVGDFGNQGAAILNSTDIAFSSGLSLELQLGEGATNFLRVVSGNIGTLTLTNFALNDVNAGGQISVDSIAIGGVDLSGTTGSLTANGLVLTLGANMNNITVSMDNVSLNGAAVTPVNIGDIYISGLDMATNTITINGK